jgi:hypothetical protein
MANVSNMDVKERLLNYAAQNYDLFRAASQYESIYFTLKRTGWLNLFLGGVTFLLGLSNLNQGILHVWQAFLGALMVGQSLWVLIVPTRIGVLGFCIMFLLAGIWNIALFILGAGAGLTVVVGFVGIIQIKWGIDYYRWYRRLSGPITGEASQLLNEVRTALINTDPATASDTIEYQSGGLWRVWLLSDMAVSASVKHKYVFVTHRNDFYAQRQPGRSGNEELVNVVLYFEQGKAKVVMLRAHLKRFEEWKAASASPLSPSIAE